MIHALFSYHSSFTEYIYSLLMTALSLAFVIFVTMPIHEWAHGFAAYLMGDKTAKYSGRLTLNPMAHIDPLGAGLVALFGFGWAKPVPVSINNFKNPKFGMAITALAGPASNILMAFILAFLGSFVGFLGYIGIITNLTLVNMILTLFVSAASINVSLGVFNLIPITPLDGSRILAGLLPDKLYYRYLSLDRYAYVFIIAILLISSRFDLVYNISSTITHAFVNLWTSVFGYGINF